MSLVPKQEDNLVDKAQDWNSDLKSQLPEWLYMTLASHVKTDTQKKSSKIKIQEIIAAWIKCFNLKTLTWLLLKFHRHWDSLNSICCISSRIHYVSFKLPPKHGFLLGEVLRGIEDSDS